MRKSAKKTLVLVVGVIVALTLFAGCEEENQSDTKASTTRSRFIANENRQLKEKIKELNRQHKREIERWENLLAKCQKEKKDLEELSSKGFDKYMENILGPLSDENTKLRVENENLKSQIKMLQAQIKLLKKQLE